MTAATHPSKVIDPQETVGDLVTRNPSVARVFERHGIDYCCQGATTLQLACATRGMSLEAVLLDLVAIPPDPHAPDCAAMSLAELTGHIVRVHHEPLRSDLPRMEALLEKVIMAHGEREPRLKQLRGVFLPLKEELLTHMGKEEQILFPWVRAIEDGRTFGPPMQSVSGPISCMMNEHEDAGAALESLRRLTDGYEAPAHACPTWHALYSALADFESDMHRHVHKENSILFPRTLKLAGVEPARGCGTGGCGHSH